VIPDKETASERTVPPFQARAAPGATQPSYDLSEDNTAFWDPPQLLWKRNLAGILDDESTASFLDHVIEQFKNQRMCSPPIAAQMTITITGNMSSERFRDLCTQRS
jgi:hypothetical protein